MNKLILVLILAAIVSVAVAHEGHEHATGVVRERMELMTSIGQRMLASSKQLRANKDLQSVTNDARAIHELASIDAIPTRQYTISYGCETGNLARVG